MEYRKYHVGRLKEQVFASYGKLSRESRLMTIPALESNVAVSRDYFAIVHSVNRLVEMGELDFDVEIPLEELVKKLS